MAMLLVTVVTVALSSAFATVHLLRARDGAAPPVFTDELLPAVRRAAQLVPGELPQSIGVLTLTRFHAPASRYAEGASDDSVPLVRAAFQIRFRDSWMMVDAGLGPEFHPRRESPTASDYDRLQAALRGARLNVVTHEHQDHIAGIVRSTHRLDLKQTTLLTRAQIRGLLAQDIDSPIRIDSAAAARFLVVDYDPLFPLAPGVVLIKAPGHTPGSQIVYVRLASGQEVVFAGDIAYLMSAVELGQQKPPRSDLTEDREALRGQIDWLWKIWGEGVAIVLAHDDASLTSLIERGVIQPDIDLTRP